MGPMYPYQVLCKALTIQLMRLGCHHLELEQVLYQGVYNSRSLLQKLELERLPFSPRQNNALKY